jgi:alpha-glucosidase
MTLQDIQRVILTILFASRGTALFYYGDEIAMKTTPPTRKEDAKYPVGLTGWPKEKGRDGERTPMY